MATLLCHSGFYIIIKNNLYLYQLMHLYNKMIETENISRGGEKDTLWLVLTFPPYAHAQITPAGKINMGERKVRDNGVSPETSRHFPFVY